MSFTNIQKKNVLESKQFDIDLSPEIDFREFGSHPFQTRGNIDFSEFSSHAVQTRGNIDFSEFSSHAVRTRGNIDFSKFSSGLIQKQLDFSDFGVKPVESRLDFGEFGKQSTKEEKTTKEKIKKALRTLNAEEKQLVEDLKDAPIEQVLVTTSLEDTTEEKKETIARVIFSNQQKSWLSRDELWKLVAQNSRPAIRFAVKMVIITMVTVVLCTAFSTFSLGSTLNVLWKLFGWEGLSILGTMGIDLTKAIGMQLGTGGIIRIFKYSKTFRKYSQKTIMNQRAKNYLKSIGITTATLDSTWEDVLSTSINTGATIYTSGIHSFITGKIISTTISTGLAVGGIATRTATRTATWTATAGIRGVQNFLSTVPQRTNNILARMQKNNPQQHITINQATKQISEELESELQEELESELGLNLQDNLQTEKVEEKEVEEKEVEEKTIQQTILEQKSKIITGRNVAIVTSLAGGLAAALITQQFDQAAYIESLSNLITTNSIGARVVARKTAQIVGENASKIATSVTNAVGPHSETVRKIIFTGIISSTGFPQVLVKYGKYLTVDQINKLKILNAKILSADSREKDGFIKSFFDVLIGRYYTLEELNQLSREELAAILNKNNIKFNRNANRATLRKLIREMQKDKQDITYKLALDTIATQTGTLAASMLLQSQSDKLWSSKEILLNTISDPTNIPLFNPESKYYISPEERQAFNIMVKSKEMIGDTVIDSVSKTNILATTALTKITDYLTTISTVGGIGVEQSQTLTNTEDITQAQKTIKEALTVTDIDEDIQVKKAEDAILVLTDGEEKISDLQGDIRASINLETLISEQEEIQIAKDNAIKKAMERIEKRTASSEIVKDAIALLPDSIEYDKQRMMAELKADIEKSPAQYHKEHERKLAKLQIQAHKQRLETEQKTKAFQDFLESKNPYLQSAKDELSGARTEAIERAKQRLLARELKSKVPEITGKLMNAIIGGQKIDGKIIPSVAVKPDNFLNDEKVMESLNMEFTPIGRKIVNSVTPTVVSYVPILGQVIGAVKRVYNIADTASMTVDITDMMLRVNDALPEENKFISPSYAPAKLPSFLTSGSEYFKKLDTELTKWYNTGPKKVNLSDIIKNAAVDSIIYGWTKYEFAQEVAKHVVGKEDIDKIKQVSERIEKLFNPNMSFK